jgi:dTDP-4-dehydrorhamnose reductase
VSTKKSILVTGSGQLGWELAQTVPMDVAWVSAPRARLDITDEATCRRVIGEEQPDWVINTAAYTAVDRAETEPEQAFAVNEKGIANLAGACQEYGARLLHVSTDFVFNGSSGTPYKPYDEVCPLSEYGRSKQAGEKALMDILPNAVIIRTSWLYSCHGSNFVKTMLRLLAERPHLNVVADQVGAPTWARGLAETLWSGVCKQVSGGIYHWSDAGVASWYDFAVAIQDISLEKGLLTRRIPINPISTTAYPTPARRPAYSVLDKSSTLSNFDVSCQHWRHQLARMLDQLKDLQ